MKVISAKFVGLVSEANARFRDTKLCADRQREFAPYPPGVMTPGSIERWFASRGHAVRASVRVDASGVTVDVEPLGEADPQ